MKKNNVESRRDDAVKVEYDRLNRRRWLLFGGGIIVMVLMSICAVRVGSADLSIWDVIRAVAGKIAPGTMENTSVTKANIIWQLRMPRILMAIVCGAGLSMCGAVMQGITRNPLVSPYTIGISNAAAFGASLSIMFGGVSGIAKDTLTILSAFAMALVCAALVYAVSSLRGMKPITLVLMGVALAYLFSAFTSTLQYLANVYQLEAIVRWTFGSLTGVTWVQVGIVSAILLMSFPIFLWNSWALNAMASEGDEVSRGLGVNATRVRIVTGLTTVFVAAGIISFTGVIGFIGIVGPHVARMIVGGNHRFLIPYSAIFGAVLLLVSDTIGRTLFAPIIIPVGIVVAYVGVPLFVHLIISHKKEYFE
ncbi:MAG: FecCD family ABC transporter permease [Candidatus Humimicrobiaceae bacterium]